MLLEEFVQKIDPEKVAVSLTFHPAFNALEDIIKKKKFLADHGFFSDYINLCAYPPYLKELNEYASIIERPKRCRMPKAM